MSGKEFKEGWIPSPFSYATGKYLYYLKGSLLKFSTRTLSVADEGLLQDLFQQEGIALPFSGLGARNTKYFGGFSSEEELVAVVAMTWSNGFEGVKIFNVLTKKLHRRRGYMKALVLYAHRQAIELGFKYAWLQVNPVNLPANSLYLGLGYKHEAERPDRLAKQFGAAYATA